MNEKAIAARQAYLKKWRADNREHIRDYHKEWRAKNKDKVKANEERYWMRKAEAAEMIAE